MPETLSHLAGPTIILNGRVVQRCVICGAKLCDSLNCAMPLEPDGSDPEFPTWPKGEWVQVTTGIPGVINWTLLGDLEKIPEDSCIEFI